ncbi:WD repeat-containing protein 27 [Takifugu flavidus]|uniref:WD repeat-containing protein 27 n=1 Tax=Takifugu flavidus TaxID=433684 RepID=A0A5C6PJ64_9TELE|nr:WD repeat-containing protein 27 [Takifugu flavidus]
MFSSPFQRTEPLRCGILKMLLFAMILSFFQFNLLIQSASPLVSVLFREENRHLIVGSADGQVWCFSLHDDLKCHLVTKMDLEKLEKRYKGRSGSVSHQTGNAEQSAIGKVEISKPILKMASCFLCNDATDEQNSSPALPESPLNAEFTERKAIHPKKKAGPKDQPLVFHPKIKSSGYNQAPRDVFHRDPADTAAPSVPQVDVSTGNKPVCCLQYSGDGKQILCGLGDSSLLLYSCSLAGSPTVYSGHDKPVSSVSWSLNRRWWLSASEDGSLRVWTHSRAEPAIIMDNSNFSKPIKSAQFYYLDKFLLLASGPSLHLYLYNIDTSSDDIKR